MSPESAARSKSGAMQGHVALVVVQLCFGLFPIFGVLALAPGGFAPLAIAGWRMLFGGIVLMGAAVFVHGRRAWPERRDWWRLVAASLLGVTLNMTLYLEGLARSTPINAALIMCLIPVFTFLLAVMSRQETVTSLRVAGVVIALVGGASRFFAERPDLVREHAFGNLLMAANAACYAAYFVIARPLLSRYPPLVVIAWVFLLSVPFVPLFAHGETFVPDGATIGQWRALAFILVFPTAVAYVLNVFALARLSASTTAIYIYVQPLVTVGASAWILQEELTPAMGVSALLVFVGIWLVARRPARIVAT